MTGANKITTNNAGKNFWQEFMRETTALDNEGGHPYGFHWLWGIYFLHQYLPEFSRFQAAELQKKFPDITMLQKIDDAVYFEEPPDPSIDELQDFLHQNGLFPLSTDMINMFEKIEKKEIIDFSNVQFDNQADFLNFIFPVPVSFQNTKFCQDVSFIKTCFYSSADFTVTKFSGSSNFNNAKFVANVTFDSATFSSSASFHSTTFADDAVFNGAIFSNSATFTKATFARIASFDDTEFRNILFFPDATFTRGATFTDAIFSHRAIFDQIIITGYTSFRHAEFKQYPPSFHKVDMYSDIIWDEIRWPILNKKSNIRAVDQNKSGYENLASHMKKLDKYHDEHFFYREEMRCRRWLAGYPTKCFYWLYESLSDYGYGIKQALLWWFGHIVLGTFLLFIHRFFSPIGKWYDDLGCSFGISFSNAHSFLFFNAGPLLKCKEHLDKIYFFNTIWFFQTILGAIFLFMLLLTLRIRFRLK